MNNMTTSSSQKLNLESLGAMFVPPPPANNMVRELSDRHSDTEVEMDDDEHVHIREQSPKHNNNYDDNSVARSMSGEVILLQRQGVAPLEEPHRAVHRIRLSALTRNYHEVQAAASRQKCAVIVVVKADGYGHGAITTALHLADYCGADSFAVATLEEGIALRKAFAANPPGRWSKQLASMFHTQHHHDVTTSADSSTATAPSYLTAAPTLAEQRELSRTPTMRPALIRIVVLGPPVGYPRCFDDYFHHNIEVMVSGPEVAQSLMLWVADVVQRRKTEVQRAASEAKYNALYSYRDRDNGVNGGAKSSRPASVIVAESPEDKLKTDGSVDTETTTVGSLYTENGGSIQDDKDAATGATAVAPKKVLPHQSSTLGNVQGSDLAREVRLMILHQQEAKRRQQQHQNSNSASDSAPLSETCSVISGDSEHSPSAKTTVETENNGKPVAAAAAPAASGTLFGGIEAAARSSRAAQAATARAQAVLYEDDDDFDDEEASASSLKKAAPAETKPGPNPIRKRLRWHALVDSGMGRLGFRPEIVKPGDTTGRTDSVAILKELVDMELEGNAPLEFYGMCTHMADAQNLEYSSSQISRFVGLLKRVRAAGISVPTVSTDNSAALLTTSLTHFDPVQMLAQAGADTRGYVRTGGAIYGQRPAFKQLQAVSTLLASVRHVAILKKGDSVGYDRAYVAPHDVRIATLTIGFADGYPRELGNGVGKVQIRGGVFPVAGNVCMDMLMVDLGPASEKTGLGANIAVGDTAVLWGPLDEDVENEGHNHMVRLQDIAATLKTTQSALTCGLDKMRVRRQFV